MRGRYTPVPWSLHHSASLPRRCSWKAADRSRCHLGEGTARPRRHMCCDAFACFSICSSRRVRVKLGTARCCIPQPWKVGRTQSPKALAVPTRVVLPGCVGDPRAIAALGQEVFSLRPPVPLFSIPIAIFFLIDSDSLSLQDMISGRYLAPLDRTGTRLGLGAAPHPVPSAQQR
ncbi:hypothetical protein C8R45DRAFT_1000053 [Mycena sanguinolenta]|nr:hypothetical protein C8R45DRAFT_1000053 [Mycena sanguinolenta]